MAKRKGEVVLNSGAEAEMHKLPLTAAAEDEIRWMRAHPAMLKKLPITLTVEDIRGAPSQAAVIQLAHWLTDRDKFYQQLLMEQRKVAPLNDRAVEDESGIERQIEEILQHFAEQSGWRGA